MGELLAKRASNKTQRVIALKGGHTLKADVRGRLSLPCAKTLKIHNLSCLYRIMPACLRLEIRPFFKS
jgi:hypothetical protein